MRVTEAGIDPRTVRAELWQNPNFCWLFVTSSISFFGNQFSVVAIPWLALRMSGSPTVLAATMALIAIPQVSLILLGGATADRYSARTILALTNCLNAAVLAVLAISTMSGVLQIHLLFALTFLSGTAAAFAIPAASSLLPRIVSHDSLSVANSLFMMSRQMILLLGPITAGSLITALGSGVHDMASGSFVGVAGVSAALAIDAVTFLIAAFLVRFIDVPLPLLPIPGSVLTSVAEGLRWFWNDRPLRTLLLYWGAMLLLGIGPWQIGVPVLADTQFRYGATGLGILLTTNSLGTIVGMATASLRSNRRIATVGTTILCADIIFGASLIALTQTNSMVIAATLCILMGMGGGYVQVGVVTWIQQRIPPNMLGRVMSVMTLVFMGAAPLSATITGALLTQLSIRIVLLGCGFLLLLIASSFLWSSTLRSIDTPPAPSRNIASK